MTAVLRRLHVENWRGIRSLDQTFGDGLTWLVGPNGTGKSSLLDALAFLADVVRAGTEARSARLRGHLGTTGLLPFYDLLHDASAPARWALEVVAAGQEWRYALELAAQADGFTVVGEQLERKTMNGWASVLEVSGGSARWIRDGTVIGDGRWEPVTPPLGATLLGRADPGVPTAHAVVQVLRGTWLLRMDPLLMRGSVGVWTPGQPLERYGADIASWAVQVVQGQPALESRLGQVAEVLGWRGLKVAVADGRPRLILDEGDGRARPWAHASDGQAVHLALALLALFTPTDLRLLLLDEPAVAVDRDAAVELAGWIAEVSDSAQVLAATQELDAVDEASRDRVLLFRRGPGGAPIAQPLHEDQRASDVPGVFRAGETAREVWRTEDRSGDE